MNKEVFQETLKNNPFSSLNDLVFNTILQDIVTIGLTPGEKISSLHIANQLGVSRSPVKIAIERLLSEKLIIRSENGNLNVAPLSKEDHLYICETRKIIEGSASFYAAKRINNVELKELEKILKKADNILLSHIDSNLNNIGNLIFLDIQFHSKILNACRNPYIIEMYDNIKNRVQRYSFYQKYRYKHNLMSTDFFYENNRERYAILKAIENGLSAIAQSEMEFHIDKMKWNFS
ncbi:GntR family transcriptional regulator [Clostridium sp. P21]|uniref:GntR family transcriptional regulator n=1 Tax=Clostridium muellerianum TaxID=2716538 RepID=A0A7Y0EH65_9CLOT|nr:GntR family transcriptional regulator [Clostridium muellerianum]NMM63388.1 GntR family transcriptional regulator [Clostridium muellerianum]